MFTIPLNVSLITLLNLISGVELNWSILHIWATSKVTSSLNILDLEKKVENDKGYILSLSQLKELSDQFEQIIDCTIIGCFNDENLPNKDASIEQLRKSCDLVIEMVDSTEWNISGRNEDLMQRFKGLAS